MPETITDEEIEKIKNRFKHTVHCKKLAWGKHACNCNYDIIIKAIDDTAKLISSKKDDKIRELRNLSIDRLRFYHEEVAKKIELKSKLKEKGKCSEHNKSLGLCIDCVKILYKNSIPKSEISNIIGNIESSMHLQTNKTGCLIVFKELKQKLKL